MTHVVALSSFATIKITMKISLLILISLLFASAQIEDHFSDPDNWVVQVESSHHPTQPEVHFHNGSLEIYMADRGATGLSGVCIVHHNFLLTMGDGLDSDW